MVRREKARLLHPSVVKVQVEPYSLCSARVWRGGGGGRAGRKEGQREGGSGELEGQGWERRKEGRISPEGDNGRAAHRNGCRAGPSPHN